jgi:hypothetical protein
MIAKLIRIVAFGGILAIPALGYAQSGPSPPPQQGKGKVHAACAADVDRLCGDAKGDRHQVHACLKAHETDLSAGCKAALQEAREYHHPQN